MDCLQERIGNEKEPIYNMQEAQKIYYQEFGDPSDDDENDLRYRMKIIDFETTNINEPYLEWLEEYLNAEVAIPNKEGILVLEKVKKQK